MIRSAQIMDKRDLDEFFGFQGILAACRKAMNSTVHTTSRATPTQLVFGRDAMLNASFQADWQFIKECKQLLILQNNKRENAKCTPHTYNDNGTNSFVIQSTNQSRVPSSSRPRADVHPKGKDTRSNPEHKLEQKR